MSDIQAAPIQGTAPISTTLDQSATAPAGGGTPNLTPDKAPAKPEKPEAAGDTLRGELARIREQEAKDAEQSKAKGEDAVKDAKAKVDEAEKVAATKDKPEVKVEAEKVAPKPDAKEPADAAEKSAADKPADGQEGDKSRPSEGQKRNDPPARFLPKAKESWINVPHAVRDEVHRMEAEHEAEVSKYREASEAFEPIRKFHDMAKASGTTLDAALTRFVGMENLLRSDPVKGVAAVLQQIGITPQQYAQHVMANPQAHVQQAQPRQDPVVSQMSSQIKALQDSIRDMHLQSASQTIIEPFRAAHPRYQALESDIAFFLQSGKIPASLSPVERLSAAYDMAERINPVGSRSVSAPNDNAGQVAAKPAAADPAGGKSIRGAPSGGSDPDDDDGDVTDIRKLLEREKRKLAS